MARSSSENGPVASHEGAGLEDDEAAASDPSRGSGLVTDALRANLERTAVEVVIPDEHRVLLEISAPWMGVHQATEELLYEMHHAYAGWPQALEDLNARATGDLRRYVDHDRGPEAIEVFLDLYEKIAREATPAPLRDRGLRLWIRYLRSVAARVGDRLPAFLPAVGHGLGRLESVLAGAPERGVAVSSELKRLARELTARGRDGDVPRRAADLLVVALDAVYRRWASEADPVEWYRAIVADSEGRAGRELPEAIEGISRRRLRALAARLAELAPDGASDPEQWDALIGLPDDLQIAQAYLAAADVFGRDREEVPRGLHDRLHWLLRVVSHDGLAPIHEQALRRVSSSCASLLEAAPEAERATALREVFALLRGGGFAFSLTVSGLVRQLGRLVLDTGDDALAAVLIEELLSLDFQYPEFAGFTSEWDVRVNPAHLRQVRTFLSVIEARPALARQLIVGLVAHLRLGGVFVADTDLFQRDISSLLARPIAPVYLEARQFLRLVPAYFNEIGAEGSLRETSTRLDEITGRKDPLCHFLRKQSHVECNPALIDLAEQVLRFWGSGDPTPLRKYVPASVLEELGAGSADSRRLAEATSRLAERVGGVEALLEEDQDRVRELARGQADLDPLAAERVGLLLEVRREIARKYRIDHQDLIDRLRAFRRTDARRVDDLESALAAGTVEEALDHVLGILEELQSIVLAPGESAPFESIYRKRHIAAGIPSMYGSYREDRFEATGLSFRAESLATALIGAILSKMDDPAADSAALARVARTLRSLLRALRVDGFRARGLEHSLEMLEEALVTPGVVAAQHLDIFRQMSHRIEDVIRARILEPYGGVVPTIVRRLLDRELLPRAAADPDEATQVHTESFMRDLIAECLGLQELDELVGRTIRALVARRAVPAEQAPSRIDIDRWAVPIRASGAAHGDGPGPVRMGNKGYMLLQLAGLGFPVPEGFVLTTDMFRARGELARSPELRNALAERIARHVGAIEQETGLMFGDPSRPLLLSVRSGAAISMPGMLETFLNVGINEDVVAGVAATRGQWAAWDAYRRFLQTWGMSHGIERQVFDELIEGAKRAHRVQRKSFLSAIAMKELALRYRRALADAGVAVIDDPREQLLACIDLVQASWDSARARLYRRELQIAEEWGTAVIVQRMVFGNLSHESGTGVALTHDPQRASRALELCGDFAVQAQGDDVVSGLVETLPIGERQRRARAHARTSLETRFPQIHAELARMASVLIEDVGMNHQEVEFTFEGDRAEDLFVLQTRDVVVAPGQVLAVFEPSDALEQSLVATGVGVGGGALSGRAAHGPEDVAALRQRFPQTPVILLRRDTVPDDLPTVIQVDGLLTAVGGTTSHAAVGAKRLGKVCVVGCRDLDVRAGRSRSQLAGHEIETGTPISINGLDGSVYLGFHPVTHVPVGEGPPAPMLGTSR